MPRLDIPEGWTPEQYADYINRGLGALAGGQVGGGVANFDPKTPLPEPSNAEIELLYAIARGWAFNKAREAYNQLTGNKNPLDPQAQQLMLPAQRVEYDPNAPVPGAGDPLQPRTPYRLPRTVGDNPFLHFLFGNVELPRVPPYAPPVTTSGLPGPLPRDLHDWRTIAKRPISPNIEDRRFDRDTTVDEIVAWMKQHFPPGSTSGPESQPSPHMMSKFVDQGAAGPYNTSGNAASTTGDIVWSRTGPKEITLWNRRPSESSSPEAQQTREQPTEQLKPQLESEQQSPVRAREPLGGPWRGYQMNLGPGAKREWHSRLRELGDYRDDKDPDNQYARAELFNNMYRDGLVRFDDKGGVYTYFPNSFQKNKDLIVQASRDWANIINPQTGEDGYYQWMEKIGKYMGGDNASNRP